MKGIIRATVGAGFFVLLSLVLCNTTVAQMPPDNVQGDWTIYATSLRTGETVVKHVQIAQYGNQLTGYFEGPDQSGPIQGRVNIHHIVFSTVTRTVLTFRGQIFGDSMSGLWSIRGQHAPWQAVRPSTASVVPVPSTTGMAYQSQPEIAPPGAVETPAPAPAPAPAPMPASLATQSAPAPQSNNGPAPAPLSADQLDSLVAPIALYPDALVAQVLAAATNPDQVAYADDWVDQNKNLTGQALAQAVDEQSWDPSVKALTQFPSVLDNLAHNLSWTSSLGQAYANQQADVMQAVQTMRARAQAAGTLQSNAQITVTTPSTNTIVIQPTNPQVVYVPQYNPAVVYGAAVVVPLYVPPPVPVASFGLYFGGGISIGAFVGGGWGGGFGWGWHAWGVNWGGGWGGGGGSTIIYNHTTYINKRVWNTTNYNNYHRWGQGNPGGGYVAHAGGATGSENHAYYGANGTYHPDAGYRPGADTHYGPNGAYHPNGYFGPDGGWHSDKGNPDVPHGGDNGNHGLMGGNGGVEHPPNGGANGNNGMIGGQGGVRDRNAGMNGPGVAPKNGYHDVPRSHMAGDGRTARAENNRGRASMARSSHPHPQHEAHAHPVAHHSGGGGRRR